VPGTWLVSGEMIAGLQGCVAGAEYKVRFTDTQDNSGREAERLSSKRER